MDVEGAEWDFLKSVSETLLDCFSQMTFELHEMPNMERRKQVITALKKLNKTHQVIWVHGNNNGDVATAGNIDIPVLLEITYANRKQYKFIPAEYNCPLDIDEPNIKERPEIILKKWGMADLYR